MHAIALLFALAAPGQMLPEDVIDDGQRWPAVVQEVDCISVAHFDGSELVFFWGRVQGEWTCLDYRWQPNDMAVRHCDGETEIWWQDWEDSCWRLVRTRRWIESWERESPLAGNANQPWFARVAKMGVGLDKPK